MVALLSDLDKLDGIIQSEQHFAEVPLAVQLESLQRIIRSMRQRITVREGSGNVHVSINIHSSVEVELDVQSDEMCMRDCGSSSFLIISLGHTDLIEQRC